jgi:DNA mismatch repair protein MutS
MEQNLTPMLKQYFEIKKSYQDSILFFRMGDFYEMFFEDAKKAAPILEIVLTTRDKKKENSVPLCGIPYHARNYYAAKLLKKGYKVAICEQVEDPATAVGIVKRDVTCVLTPGTALEIEEVDKDIDNYIISVYQEEKSISIASVDLSVSDFEVRCYDLKDEESFINEIYRKYPREVVCPESYKLELNNILRKFPEMANIMINTFKGYEYNFHECQEVLKNQLKIASVEGIGMEGYPGAVIASVSTRGPWGFSAASTSFSMSWAAAATLTSPRPGAGARAVPPLIHRKVEEARPCRCGRSTVAADRWGRRLESKSSSTASGGASTREDSAEPAPPTATTT